MKINKTEYLKNTQSFQNKTTFFSVFIPNYTHHLHYPNLAPVEIADANTGSRARPAFRVDMS